VSRTRIVDSPAAERARRRAAVRRARSGSLVALHFLLLCAAGRPPTEIAAVRSCSRSTVYRAVKAYQEGRLAGGGAEGQGLQPARLTVLAPALKRSVWAILHAVPRACGGCRPRWSCATIALGRRTRRGMEGSAETVRRGLPELDWGGKRAKLAAKADAPQRGEQLGRMRPAFEQARGGLRSPLPLNSRAVCCPRSALTGCRGEPGWRSGRRAPMRNAPGPERWRSLRADPRPASGIGDRPASFWPPSLPWTAPPRLPSSPTLPRGRITPRFPRRRRSRNG
jgi:Winged helix-turn helix